MVDVNQTSSFQVFMAKYSYDPEQYSPNENPDVELALTAGDYLFVYGDMDEVRRDPTTVIHYSSATITHHRLVSPVTC